MKKYCRIRKDLVKKGLGIPLVKPETVGLLSENGYYIYGPAKRRYRWVNADKRNERFEILYRGKWYDANSIDYDF